MSFLNGRLCRQENSKSFLCVKKSSMITVHLISHFYDNMGVQNET